MVRYCKFTCEFVKKDGTLCGKPCTSNYCRDHKKCALGGYTKKCDLCGAHNHSKVGLCEACLVKTRYYSKISEEKKRQIKILQKEIDEKMREIDRLSLKPKP